MPWGIIVDIAMKIVGLFLDDKAKRDKLKLQMYEFAKQFDKNAIDRNEKLRAEYKRMKDELEKSG